MNPPENDAHNLERFIAAQRGIHDVALAELKAGAKRSHWMWFVFPQVAGLGTSAMAQRYAINSRAEAVAYLAHPVLGPRLLECTTALLQVTGKSAEEIMGPIDCAKLKSSMTLFAALTPSGSVFAQVLTRYYDGERDARTLDYLASHA